MMKMKFLVLFSLLLVAHSAFAQSAPKEAVTAPQVAALIEKLALPYSHVKSFRGNFDLSFEETVEDRMQPVFECQMQTIYRLDSAGNKIREVSRVTTRYKRNSKFVLESLKVVDDGKTQKEIASESKIYALTERSKEIAPIALLAPALRQIVRVLRRDISSVSTISKGIEAGRGVIIVDSKGKKYSSDLHAVVDTKTGVLQNLNFSFGRNGFVIRASEQVFNPRLSESQFRWVAPKAFKQVAESQLPDISRGLQSKPTPTKVPDN